MDTDVIIKANAHGIIVVLNDSIAFETLIASVRQKFMKSVAHFKERGNVYVSFQGRKLSGAETDCLLHVMNHIPGIDVCFLKKQELAHGSECALMIPPQTVSRKIYSGDKVAVQTGTRNLFYQGQLRSGQILEVKKSIIILGDVWQGAKIISGGNIIIIGNLYGTAVAGRDGHPKRFVLAQNMQPVHIQIGNVKREFSQRNQKKFHTKDAVMAYIENGRMIFEALSHTSF